MGISPAARGYPRPRLGDVLDERGHPRPLARGIPDRLGDIPGPSGDAPPASWSLVPHTQVATHMCRVCHFTRSKPTQQHVKRRLCDTTRPSEGSCCAAVAAAHAQPSCPGARRGPASHTARRGEASGGQSRPQTTVCAAVWRALFDRADEPPRPGQREERGLREAAEPASLRHGKERGRGVQQGAEARRCGVLEPRAEAPARESTRRLS